MSERLQSPTRRGRAPAAGPRGSATRPRATCRHARAAGDAARRSRRHPRRQRAAQHAERAVFLRLQQREAVALDDPRVARAQHDVLRVVLLRDPHGAARDAQRRAAEVRQREALAGGQVDDRSVLEAGHGRPPLTCVECIRLRIAAGGPGPPARSRIALLAWSYIRGCAGLPQTLNRHALHALRECIRRCAACRRSTSSAASRPRAGACRSRSPRRNSSSRSRRCRGR